jgi:hypothetical protein
MIGYFQFHVVILTKNSTKKGNQMKGTVLKPFTGNSLSGITKFLAMWQEDALKAIGECLMGDRDSYPGQYISQLIDDGFLSADEVEQACIEWLIEGKFMEKYGHLGLDEVISMPRKIEPKFQKLSLLIATHFKELLCRMKGDWSEHQLVHAASLAEDIGRTAWNLLDDLFREKYWNDIGLFENLYANSRHSNPMIREQRLQLVAKNARYMKRAYGENDSILQTLRFMLHKHFGYTYERGKNTPGLFELVEARVHKWIISQNAHMAP